MKRFNRREKKVYYVGMIKSNNNIIVTFTKTALSEFIGVSVDTIRRHLNSSSIYITDEFIVWSGITIDSIKRGFALHTNRKYNY